MDKRIIQIQKHIRSLEQHVEHGYRQEARDVLASLFREINELVTVAEAHALGFKPYPTAVDGTPLEG